ncbi:MAG: hypothetical protein HC853_06915 [Anaerolineae bacterium]|nr:hypothetical protein [Anaerolineae bacterium]
MVPLNSYTALVVLSVCVGLALALWQTRDWNLLTGALIMGACALLLGRVGYVALHGDYFANNVNQILSLASPGYQEHAALAGGCIGYWLLAKRHSPIANSQWPLVLCASLIDIAASFGCISHSCAYGREVFWQSSSERSLAWLLAVDWPDAYGISNPRLPTQLFMAGWLALVGVFMAIWAAKGARGRRSKGEASSSLIRSPAPLLSWLLLFALGDFAIQFARADATLTWAGLRAEQWADVVFGALAAAGIVQTRLRKK